MRSLKTCRGRPSRHCRVAVNAGRPWWGPSGLVCVPDSATLAEVQRMGARGRYVPARRSARERASARRHSGHRAACHAGCETDAILAAAGLTHADICTPQTKEEPRIVAEYCYRDEAGTPLYHVVRFDPKDFRVRRADGQWTLSGVRRVLYRLPDLQGKSTAYIGEGEKDADRLRAIGLPATTAFGGAGKWNDT